MPIRYWVAVAGLLAAVFGASYWYGRTAPEPAPLEVAADSEVATITVHVAGEVTAPGLVRVSGDARVADAVAAAGGSTREADLSLVNLAASLRDGEQIVEGGPPGEATRRGRRSSDASIIAAKNLTCPNHPR